MLCFLLALFNLRPQESEGLKVGYGLKFFYLAENVKSFSTHWYANDKDVIFCGNKNSDLDNDYCDSCFRKYSHDGNAECTVSCLMLTMV